MEHLKSKSTQPRYSTTSHPVLCARAIQLRYFHLINATHPTFTTRWSATRATSRAACQSTSAAPPPPPPWPPPPRCPWSPPWRRSWRRWRRSLRPSTTLAMTPRTRTASSSPGRRSGRPPCTPTSSSSPGSVPPRRRRRPPPPRPRHKVLHRTESLSVNSVSLFRRLFHKIPVSYKKYTLSVKMTVFWKYFKYTFPDESTNCFRKTCSLMKGEEGALFRVLLIPKKCTVFQDFSCSRPRASPALTSMQLLKKVSSSKTDSNVFVKAYSLGNRIRKE